MKNLFCAAAASLLFLGSSLHAATILNYDLTGVASVAITNYAATTTDPGLTEMDLTRGAGLVATNLANGFSSNDWTLNSSAALAITNGDYYQWGFTINPNHSASLSTLDFNLRRSAVAAANNFDLYVSTDSFATSTDVSTFNYFGRSSGTAPGSVTPYQWMTTDTAGQDGNPISTIDLSTTSLLQNIPAGTTVTFRLYGWTNTSGAASTNTVAFGRNQGPLIGGTVTLVPEPASLSLLALAATPLLRRRR